MRINGELAPVPLIAMTRHLAPFVGAGMLSFAEALDFLMGVAIHRFVDEYGRLLGAEDYLGKILADEAVAWQQRATAGAEQPMRRTIAEAQIGVAWSRLHESRRR